MGWLITASLETRDMPSRRQFRRARMRGEERRQARRVTACHAALGSDAVHADVTAGRRKAGPAPLGGVPGEPAEIEAGLLAQPQLFGRRAKSSGAAAPRGP